MVELRPAAAGEGSAAAAPHSIQAWPSSVSTEPTRVSAATTSAAAESIPAATEIIPAATEMIPVAMSARSVAAEVSPRESRSVPSAGYFSKCPRVFAHRLELFSAGRGGQIILGHDQNNVRISPLTQRSARLILISSHGNAGKAMRAVPETKTVLFLKGARYAEQGFVVLGPHS